MPSCLIASCLCGTAPWLAIACHVADRRFVMSSSMYLASGRAYARVRTPDAVSLRHHAVCLGLTDYLIDGQYG